ncbi:translocation protein SEC62 [Marchantia polymorpha subsp. ruderalis]
MAKKKASADRAPDGVTGNAKAAVKEVSPVKLFSDKLRDHKELESRWAVLREARVEYFRGKDFVELLNKFPELKDILKDERPEDDDPETIGNLLLKRKLVLRCERVVRTLRPRKKKLSKWPARIELFPEQIFSEDDAFFAWNYERRRPMWQIILSFLVPVVTLACCLFPIFPHWCKLAVLYFCLAFLALIFGVLFARWAIFGIMWIFFGKRIWFLPNILAEEASLSELFKFWPEKSKEDDVPPKKTTRLAFALLTAASLWVVLHHAPDEAARSRYHKKVSNIIDDVLEWKPNLAALTGNSAEKVVINETLQNETAASESFSEDVVEPDTQTADGLLDDVIEDSSLQEETGSPGEAEDPVKGSKEHDVEL